MICSKVRLEDSNVTIKSTQKICNGAPSISDDFVNLRPSVVGKSIIFINYLLKSSLIDVKSCLKDFSDSGNSDTEATEPLKELDIFKSTNLSKNGEEVNLEKSTEGFNYSYVVNLTANSGCKFTTHTDLEDITDLEYFKTSEKQEFIKRKIAHFCESRIPAINLIYKDLQQFRKFIDTAFKLKNTIPENQIRILSQSDSRFIQLCQCWESTRISIIYLLNEIEKTFFVWNRKHFVLSLQKFYDYGDLLNNVLYDLSDLEDFGKEGFGNYRQFCLYFEDYVFLTHVFSANEIISTLLKKVEVETNFFTSFDHILEENNLVSTE